MKKINISIVILFSLLFISNFTFAQHDYQIVQQFKSQYNQLEKEIKGADSLEALDSIQARIAALRLKYQSHEELLDKSLYPDGFNSSIEKLDNALSVRRGDFTKITNLQTQVSGFKIQLEQLDRKNTQMMNQIEQLQMQNSNNRKTILHLKHNVNQLRYSLFRRDKLIMTMLDSLIPQSAVRIKHLSSGEQQKIYSRTKKTDVIANIKKAIDENIKFLEVTTLTPKDLNLIKKQKNSFQNIWKSVGPKIINIYSSRRKSVKNLKSIDSAFAAWHYAINKEAWNSIHKKFSNYGIDLSNFSNGREFTNSIKAYINDEINTRNIQGKGAENNYKTFADTVWLHDVKHAWVPYLTENNMLTKANKDTIETKIKEWKAAVSPGLFNWMYIIIVVLVIIIIFLAVKKTKTSKKDDLITADK